MNKYLGWDKRAEYQASSQCRPTNRRFRHSIELAFEERRS